MITLKTQRQTVVEDIRREIDRERQQCSQRAEKYAKEGKHGLMSNQVRGAEVLRQGLDAVKRLPLDHPLFTKALVVSLSSSDVYVRMKARMCRKYNTKTQWIRPLPEYLEEIVETYIGDDLRREGMRRVEQYEVDQEAAIIMTGMLVGGKLEWLLSSRLTSTGLRRAVRANRVLVP